MLASLFPSKFLGSLGYARLEEEQSLNDAEFSGKHLYWKTSESKRPFNGCLNSFLGFLFVIVASLVGFIAGRYPLHVSPAGLLDPAGSVIQTWHYNRTFSQMPTAETEEAWKSLFPRGRGFIHHPSLSKNVSGIAVFHELHCLSGIHLAYYAALNLSVHSYTSYISSGTGFDSAVDAANAHNDPHHIRHCFDYLRQALMCAADTNLESIDWDLNGSTGWGFERRCRDYSTVVTWAEKWRLHSQRSIE